jgi:hypothetical protein
MNKIIQLDWGDWSMTNWSMIIFHIGGNYYRVLDESDKIDDIQKMPKYISEDFWNSNKEILTLDELSRTIANWKIVYRIKTNPFGNNLKIETRNFSESDWEILEEIIKELEGV